MDFIEFHKIISRTKINHWRNVIPRTLEDFKHGDLAKWLRVFEHLPDCDPGLIDLAANRIKIGHSSDLGSITQEELKETLLTLHPWRKGPYDFFGINIDTEWRSDMKWKRLKNHIHPLTDRMILDVGCGNGYHCMRMAGEKAKLVVGVDPFLLFVLQFLIFKRYLTQYPVFVLPVGIEQLPKNQPFFDTVFSMGVFYHRKSPFEHLQDLRALLKNKGELVLETLIIEGGENEVLVPPGRYAKMRNVWFLPTEKTMLQWLKRAGFKKGRMIDATVTTTREQRRTDWMTFESLENFLNPTDSTKTVENLPAPKRAVFLAQK